MPAVVCPHCSTHVSMPAHAAGKTVKCPTCGGAFVVGGAAPAPGEAFESMRDDRGERLGPEPWFYWVISFCAFLVLLGGFASVAVMIFFVMSAAAQRMPGAGPVPTEVKLVIFGYIATTLLLTLFIASVMLLAVDIGRMLRKIYSKRR